MRKDGESKPKWSKFVWNNDVSMPVLAYETRDVGAIERRERKMEGICIVVSIMTHGGGMEWGEE